MPQLTPCALRAAVGQSSRAGLMPPSDSDEASGSEGGGGAAAGGLQNARAGLMPPSDSESGSDAEGGEERAAKPATAHTAPAAAPPPARRKEDEPDPETVREDMERLNLARQRREDQRLARIAAEGWDRFAPLSDDNRPPAPSDHPGKS